jgi:hypothetical protein
MIIFLFITLTTGFYGQIYDSMHVCAGGYSNQETDFDISEKISCDGHHMQVYLSDKIHFEVYQAASRQYFPEKSPQANLSVFFPCTHRGPPVTL